jgi:hypothetical protein
VHRCQPPAGSADLDLARIVLASALHGVSPDCGGYWMHAEDGLEMAGLPPTGPSLRSGNRSTSDGMFPLIIALHSPRHAVTDRAGKPTRGPVSSTCRSSAALTPPLPNHPSKLAPPLLLADRRASGRQDAGNIIRCLSGRPPELNVTITPAEQSPMRPFLAATMAGSGCHATGRAQIPRGG